MKDLKEELVKPLTQDSNSSKPNNKKTQNWEGKNMRRRLRKTINRKNWI
jgi:hypothetical protein